MAWRASSSKDPAAEPGAQAGIQAAEGLIKQQCLGARQQGAQQAHPRPLPAGERGRIARGEARQPGAAKRFLHRGFFAPRRARSPAAPAVNFARR